MADSDFANATTLTELKAAELGAQIGTTSLTTIEDVIQPTAAAAGLQHTDDALEAMQNGQIDGVVVDLPTAGFITTVQVEDEQDRRPDRRGAGAEAEHFSLVLEQGQRADRPASNQAIPALDDDGTLDALDRRVAAVQAAPRSSSPSAGRAPTCMA